MIVVKVPFKDVLTTAVEVSFEGDMFVEKVVESVEIVWWFSWVSGDR